MQHENTIHVSLHDNDIGAHEVELLTGTKAKLSHLKNLEQHHQIFVSKTV